MSRLTTAQHILYDLKEGYKTPSTKEEHTEILIRASENIASEASHNHPDVENAVKEMEEEISASMTDEELEEVREELW